MPARTVDNPLTIEGDANRLVRRRGRLFLLLAVPLAALAAAVYISYSQSPYERYVSPPKGPNSSTIAVLIPRGWKPQPGQAVLETATGKYYGLYFVPLEPMPWLPQWAKKYLYNREADDSLNSLSIFFTDGVGLDGENGIHTEQYGDNYSAVRNFPAPKGGSWYVDYRRSNERTLRATWRAMLDSIEVH
jgi:hypothetical protein